MTRSVTTAADYHRTTSYHRHRLTPHTLDWAHQPTLVKHYPQEHRLPLDRNNELPAIDYLDLVNRCRTAANSPSTTPDFQTISTVFRLTHEITARSDHSGQPFYYRSVASAGALYPFELYLAATHIDGLTPGVYHYHIFDFSLTALRQGPVAAIPPSDGGVLATFFITGIFFRSAWKYRSRAYRYVLMDAGHLLENLRLALGALDLAYSIHLDFDDERAAALLGLDAQREVCLACVHLHDGLVAEKPPAAADDLRPLGADFLRVSTVSDREVAYGEILEVHRGGFIRGKRIGRALPKLSVFNRLPRSWIDVKPPDHAGSVDYARLLWQRRSRRNFVPASVAQDSLMAFMHLMTRNMGTIPSMPPVCPSALIIGMLVRSGMPIPPGFYLLDPAEKRLGLLLNGDITTPMASACLDQMWLKHAGLHMLFMTDLAALDQSWGPRGYRYAMIEAGRLGQQTYLAACAVGWGACGIGAIYDREAAKLLELAVDGALLYLVGAGPVKAH